MNKHFWKGWLKENQGCIQDSTNTAELRTLADTHKASLGLVHINLIIIIMEQFTELFQCARPWVRHCTWYYDYWSRCSYEESTTIVIVILRIDKFRLWKVKKIIQHPKSSEWQSQDLNPRQCDSSPAVIIVMLEDLERGTWWRAHSKQGFPRNWRYIFFIYRVFLLRSVGRHWWCFGIDV